MLKNIQLKPLRKDLEKFLKHHGLIKRWDKAIALLENDIRHPSLHVELLEPRWRGIYSFRLDRKYRALFFITDNKVEVFQITKHYRKS
ncbi:hypothetical protein A3F08_01775 [Candidatus Berkelbacteria bacterium RIFCSPHIGHO2_12_FULL_36_9]|uniref:Toxin YoeB n=1 Tax=Candidatus Berkelbacteria bacterium RIFCSPHIGHO2_12_FULL_36_9 TaxID=1797469 RepID=A0A1F5EDQ3_9BACT|nr:MAG: hypothetical protein A3F08_01775 [Candidatus Berkelbacteria bacterium RIFCSPHIGHO2_12_FULL_36_9]